MQDNLKNMNIETFGIPLSIYPYSNKSLIINWLTSSNGLTSTILNINSKNNFNKTFSLFATSKLNISNNNNKNLNKIIECEMIDSRNDFKKCWRSTQCASYLTYLFNQTIPEHTIDNEFYNLFEQSLDLAMIYGHEPYFLIWTELNFTEKQGHKPKLDKCIFCGNHNTMRFSASQGGVCCEKCIKKNNIYSFPLNKNTKNILNYIQESKDINNLQNLKITKNELANIDLIIGTFMNITYQLHPNHRNSVLKI